MHADELGSLPPLVHGGVNEGLGGGGRGWSEWDRDSGSLHAPSFSLFSNACGCLLIPLYAVLKTQPELPPFPLPKHRLTVANVVLTLRLVRSLVLNR